MYKFENINGKCEILLYSLIDGSGFAGLTAREVIAQIKNAGKNVSVIDLRINSDGGDVFEAQAMYNYLKNHQAKVNVYIDGIAASAASIVACAGKVYMSSNAMIMIHNPVGNVYGESEDMREMAAVLDKIRDNIANIYASKTGMSLDECIKLMDAETWLNAHEALTFGFADKIIEARNEKKKEEPRDGTEEIKNAVKRERERMREIDALKITDCEKEIFSAKYERFIDAKELAYEILTTKRPAANVKPDKADMMKKREADATEIDDISALEVKIDAREAAKSAVKKINARR